MLGAPVDRRPTSAHLKTARWVRASRQLRRQPVVSSLRADCPSSDVRVLPIRRTTVPSAFYQRVLSVEPRRRRQKNRGFLQSLNRHTKRTSETYIPRAALRNW